jgi:hypothetical protein
LIFFFCDAEINIIGVFSGLTSGSGGVGVVAIDSWEQRDHFGAKYMWQWSFLSGWQWFRKELENGLIFLIFFFCDTEVNIIGVFSGLTSGSGGVGVVSFDRGDRGGSNGTRYMWQWLFLAAWQW